MKRKIEANNSVDVKMPLAETRGVLCKSRLKAGIANKTRLKAKMLNPLKPMGVRLKPAREDWRYQ